MLFGIVFWACCMYVAYAYLLVLYTVNSGRRFKQKEEIFGSKILSNIYTF